MIKLPQLPEGREMRLLGTTPTIEYRTADGGAQQPEAFVGQAIVCGVRSEVLGGPGFRFVEIIDPHALDEADYSNVEGVFNHDSNCLLGHTRSGSLTLTRTADGGLSYRIAYDPLDSDHVKVMRKIERGDVVGSSFMFTSAESDWTNEQTPDGGDLYVRTVSKIAKVYDVCPVTSPAYSDATAAKRSLDSYQQEHEADARMKGMGKDKKKAKRTLTDAEKAEQKFLQDMIPHHEMAVEMATAALKKMENKDIRAFAQEIIDNQTAEIDKMKEWLAALDEERAAPTHDTDMRARELELSAY